ncbi:N-acetylmuramoyl-L-alanine amidase [Granulicatella balaenopterae]|uniref:N-acetylmuramoyl-L-alanine amidase n=1 Tax=Granulicatella balaenopterae TaxID=137733 RepID=A0A1H9GUC0_9LACT|nr:N-acetylmuramoyl-L-alanine amidase [Granulicatella balaenopterae]SEQ53629.1 N-acetylmuramoyl-L-alanine amidase [Granulicatella balaenopterae]
MDIVIQFFKKKNVQRFIIFCMISIAIIFIAKPLIGEIADGLKDVTIMNETELYTKYDGEGNNEKTLKMISKGSKVKILETRGDWLKIKDEEGIEGWISKASLDKKAEEKTTVNNPTYQVVTIEQEQGIVYTQASVQSMRMGEVARYAHLLLLHDFGDGWAQVQYNGQVGWVETKDNAINKIATTIDSPEAVIYDKPNTSANVIVTPGPGVALQVLEEYPKFIKVKYQQYTGYIEGNKVTDAIGVLRDLLRDQTHAEQVPTNKKILVTKLNETPIVAEPNGEGQVLTTISAGTQLDYEDRDGDYYKITLTSGQVGYIPYWLVITNFAPIESDATIPTSLAEATIVLDPGHGGVDPGAVVDFSPVHEADLTLPTAQAVKAALEQKGAQVILTREDDSSVGLVERAEISNKNNADIFLSLHYDSTVVDTVSGTTVYYYSANDQSLAETVARYLKAKLPLPNNGAYFENYAVTRENNQPALLIELGYLNNHSDNAVVNSKDYQELVADAIVAALEEYFQ